MIDSRRSDRAHSDCCDWWLASDWFLTEPDNGRIGLQFDWHDGSARDLRRPRVVQSGTCLTSKRRLRGSYFQIENLRFLTTGTCSNLFFFLEFFLIVCGSSGRDNGTPKWLRFSFHINFIFVLRVSFSQSYKLLPFVFPCFIKKVFFFCFNLNALNCYYLLHWKVQLIRNQSGVKTWKKILKSIQSETRSRKSIVVIE